ncbi:hypothetical protein BOVATA_045310 [Babesia ovata]|uniref:Uncharacterized protein n=1 Tax=Babesia ovata TaxID=189622 RepID=A0A2H6KJ76_9APIC|nr:uncharacterized protein BOVATA_045310 [Babesia ovata]GBE63038.1 hypothetical protein BOVATA_045310 [Babesia ovata]
MYTLPSTSTNSRQPPEMPPSISVTGLGKPSSFRSTTVAVSSASLVDCPEITVVVKLVNIVAGVIAIKGLHEAFQADVLVVVNHPRQLFQLPRHLVGELLERELEGLDVLPARVGGEFVARIFRCLFGMAFEFADVMSFGSSDVFYKLIGVFNGIRLQTFVKFIKFPSKILQCICFNVTGSRSVTDLLILQLSKFQPHIIGGSRNCIGKRFEMLFDFLSSVVQLLRDCVGGYFGDSVLYVCDRLVQVGGVVGLGGILKCILEVAREICNWFLQALQIRINLYARIVKLRAKMFYFPYSVIQVLAEVWRLGRAG